MEKNNHKILVILGPTSAGKSAVAIKLARKFNGEIISADSRQVYRGLDIGTGKVTKNEQKMARHHMIDIVSPRTNFSAAQFKKRADKIIKDILKRGKLPIICGGTGFWIKSIVDDIIYPEVKPDWKLRNKLRDYSSGNLFKMLQKLDPVRAKNIDAKNNVRLIRAIEICKVLGKVPNINYRISNTKYDFLQIGIDLPKEKLHKNIEKRLKKRFNQGMIEEVEKLHSRYKLTWKKIKSFGLGYLLIPKYFKGDIKSKKELFDKIFQAEKDYSKRQITWFKRDRRIKWLSKYKNIENEVKSYMK